MATGSTLLGGVWSLGSLTPLRSHNTFSHRWAWTAGWEAPAGKVIPFDRAALGGTHVGQ